MWKRAPSGIILNQRRAFRQLLQPDLAAIFLGVGQVSLGQRFWDGGTHHDLLARADFIKVLTREKNLHPPWHVVLVLLPILRSYYRDDWQRRLFFQPHFIGTHRGCSEHEEYECECE